MIEATPTIHTIDLNFHGVPGSIGVYALPHRNGVVLIESGPGSTLPELNKRLAELGFQLNDITDVFLTHIHLDHAGAAGALARQGATIHVHPNGAPHLQNPEKLLASATRIYGEQMDYLWGQFLPVPENRLHILEDNETVETGGLFLQAIDTPGHANHHYAYLSAGTLFSGDIGGVRLGGLRYLRLPMPPPELNLETWRKSLARLENLDFYQVAPTHFGLYGDPDWHMQAIANELSEVEQWVEEVMPANPDLPTLREEFSRWSQEQFVQEKLDPDLLPAQELANPAFMSADGLLRYWKKFRQPE